MSDPGVVVVEVLGWTGDLNNGWKMGLERGDRVGVGGGTARFSPGAGGAGCFRRGGQRMRGGCGRQGSCVVGRTEKPRRERVGHSTKGIHSHSVDAAPRGGCAHSPPRSRGRLQLGPPVCPRSRRARAPSDPYLAEAPPPPGSSHHPPPLPLLAELSFSPAPHQEEPGPGHIREGSEKAAGSTDKGRGRLGLSESTEAKGHSGRCRTGPRGKLPDGDTVQAGARSTLKVSGA